MLVSFFGPDMVIVDAACGYKHSAAITEDGRLYTWGLGDNGALGHNNSDTLTTPKVCFQAQSPCRIDALLCVI
jgi:alpha-tubulin suppressor-like RCC1 family protein